MTLSKEDLKKRDDIIFWGACIIGSVLGSSVTYVAFLVIKGC